MDYDLFRDFWIVFVFMQDGITMEHTVSSTYAKGLLSWEPIRGPLDCHDFICRRNGSSHWSDRHWLDLLPLSTCRFQRMAGLSIASKTHRGFASVLVNFLTWPMAKRLKFLGGLLMFSRENKPFKTFFFRVRNGWVSFCWSSLGWSFGWMFRCWGCEIQTCRKRWCFEV